jgi:hypothetical protein
MPAEIAARAPGRGWFVDCDCSLTRSLSLKGGGVQG